MKERDRIPVSKVERAMKLVGTGARIGGNYLKYYAKKAVNAANAEEELHRDNADDIYASFSQMKGGALKLIQMLSMDKSLLPRAYSEKFALSQYSAPPMSGPLVTRTFEKNTGKKLAEVFDSFEKDCCAAASIGQVHRAKIKGRDLAVKIQYPGIAGSIQSDLKMVKPIAGAMFGLSGKEMDKYFMELEEKLLEETNYNLELARSVDLGNRSAEVLNVFFPKYYPEYSGDKVLVMDWVPGLHLKEFLGSGPKQEIKTRVAQALWDFYEHQLHTLRALHADPHPGNFLMQPDGRVAIIDFGCVKVVPPDFYYHYIALLLPEIQQNRDIVEKIMKEIEVVVDQDSKEQKETITALFLRMTNLLSRPFAHAEFTFSPEYLQEIFNLGQEVLETGELRGQSRGSRHALYVNRAYFGIYSIMSDLGGKIRTKPGAWREDILKFWGLV